MIKKRVAWFSTSHQQNEFSKSAYASQCLLPLLSEQLDIDLYCEYAGAELGGHKSKNFLTANQRHSEEPYDFFFYNFENKAFCNFIRIHLGLKPGIVWFHDFNLLDDGPEPILNSPWERMLKLAKEPQRTELWPKFDDLFIPTKPAAIRESSMSLFRVFSNERDLQQFRNIKAASLNDDDSGCFLPMPVAAEFFRTSQIPAQRQIAICAKPDVDSHIHSILMALKNQGSYKLMWLIDSKDRPKCLELLKEFEISDYELTEGRNIQNWKMILEKSSIVLLLLHSFYDQLQPWLAASLACAKPSVVLDFGETEYLPDSVVFKIQTGAHEVASLEAILSSLQPGDSNRLASEYALEKYSAPSVATELNIYLSQIHDKYIELSAKWQRLEETARSRVIHESIQNISSEYHQYFTEVYRELGF